MSRLASGLPNLAGSTPSSSPRPFGSSDRRAAAFAEFRRRLYAGRRMAGPSNDSPALEAEHRALFAAECAALRRECGVAWMFSRATLRDPNPALPEGYRRLAETLEGLLDAPQLMAVVGERGVGKTHLACALVLAACELGREALFCDTSAYFDRLKAGFDNGMADRTRKRFEGVCVLVLDEVQLRDEQRAWQDNQLAALVNARYARGLTTLLLSNLTPKALEANVGPLIWRRLIEQGGVVECTWPRIKAVLAGGER